MKFLKKMAMVFLSAVILLAATILIFLQQEKFGATPEGDRLERIKRSPNYKDGAFTNIHETPALTEGTSYPGILYEFLFSNKPNLHPLNAIPSAKTDLKNVRPSENIFVWFGHSSYFIQLNGLKVLIDPVFSGAASPLSFTTKAFKGTDIYTVEDLPEIDILYISHDHWDHLDHKTIKQLNGNFKKVVTGLGVGAHLERWGVDPAKIVEGDWWEQVSISDSVKITYAPARHFSGRAFKRNGTLWTSIILQSGNHKIYLGGDSGYDDHFKTIGNKFGPFEIAILENGQYDKSWKYIHMMPEELISAGKDLKAQKIIPVHNSKFSLANHAWFDPLNRVSEAADSAGYAIITPMIGEKVSINDSAQVFTRWWKNLK